LGKKISPEWRFASRKVQSELHLFAEIPFDLTSGGESAQKGLGIGAALVRSIVGGIFAMSSTGETSFGLEPSNKRKPWETPVVILASAERATLTSFNTILPDTQATSTSQGS